MPVNLNMQLNDLARCLFVENFSSITNNYEISQQKDNMKIQVVPIVPLQITTKYMWKKD